MNSLDLFSGIGGFALGFERAGIYTSAMCEIDPECRAVLRRQWPEAEIYEDIAELDGAAFRGVDVVAGGFPCQDLSDAARGANNGLDGDRSGLWYQMARVLGQAEPPFCVVENVDGAAWQRWVPTVRRTLHELGYSSLSLRMRAVDLGAPFVGRRVIVAATNRQGKSARAFHAKMARLPKPAKDRRHWSQAAGVALGLDDGVSGGVAMYGNAIVPLMAQRIGEALVSAA